MLNRSKCYYDKEEVSIFYKLTRKKALDAVAKKKKKEMTLLVLCITSLSCHFSYVIHSLSTKHILVLMLVMP